MLLGVVVVVVVVEVVVVEGGRGRRNSRVMYVGLMGGLMGGSGRRVVCGGSHEVTELARGARGSQR